MSAWRAWRDRIGHWACGGSLSLLSVSPALAQSAAAERSFALEYHAAGECPDGLALVSAIQARTAGAALVAADLAAVRIKVDLQPDGRSSLWFLLGEGAFQREFPSASCADAVASMAVIVSMVLEAAPASRRAMAEGTTEPAPAALPEATPSPAEVSPPVAPPAPPPPAPPAAPARAAPAPVAPPARPKRPRTFGLSLGGGGALETAVAPSAPLGGAAGLEIWARPSQVFAPGVHAELLATTKGTANNSDGSADFQLLAGRAKGCLLRAPLTSRTRIIPCALVEVGSLGATGGGSVSNPRQKRMPWLAGGLALRAQVDFVDNLALEASVSAKGLLRSDTFVFQPNSLVYQVPALSFGAGLGLSLRVH